MKFSGLDVWPPSVTAHVAEGAIDEAGSKLPSSDEESINGH